MPDDLFLVMGRDDDPEFAERFGFGEMLRSQPNEENVNDLENEADGCDADEKIIDVLEDAVEDFHNCKNLV